MDLNMKRVKKVKESREMWSKQENIQQLDFLLSLQHDESSR